MYNKSDLDQTLSLYREYLDRPDEYALMLWIANILSRVHLSPAMCGCVTVEMDA